MWYSMVIPRKGASNPLDGEVLGSWNGDVLGDRAAKKAAKATGREWIRNGGPGQPRLIKSPLILEGSVDMTGGLRPDTVALDLQEKREEALFQEDLAHVLSGTDIFEGSPFYESQPPEVLQEMELLFGHAGNAVASYVLGLPDLVTYPSDETVVAKTLFANAAARAEFHLRCQKFDSNAVEAWLSGHCEQCWETLQRKHPSFVGSGQKETLIAEARSLINQNWVHVMTMATALTTPSVDVEGREIEFLGRVYYEPESTAAGATESRFPPRQRPGPPTVLIIDNEAPIRLLCRVNLEAAGMHILEAPDGPTGLKLVNETRPDLILLDVMMPGPNGLQVAKQLRDNEATSTIPIVFLSPRVEFCECVNELAYADIQAVAEPFNPVELFPLLDGILRQAGEFQATRPTELDELWSLTEIATTPNDRSVDEAVATWHEGLRK